MHDNSNAPTPIFTINPTFETDPEDEHAENYDIDDDNDGKIDKVEEVEPSEEDTPDLISIEINDEDSNDKEVISEEEEYPVLEHSRGYPTRDRKQVTRLIPTPAGKTRDSGHIHLNTDVTTPNMTDIEN